MRIRTRLAITLCALVAASSVSVPAALAAPSQRVIVETVAGTTPADLVGLYGGRLGHVYRRALHGFALELPASVVAALSRDPRVVRVEVDQQVEAADIRPTGIQRIGAYDADLVDIDGDGSRVDVDVAVLDTGVDGGHPDLDVPGGADCSTGTCVEVDPHDPHGHGTHIAGTIGARDDGEGVVGVAPGARIWSLQVLDDEGLGSVSNVLAALDWVTQRGDIEVANLSFSCECTSVTLDRALARTVDSGVTVVVAAGNEGIDASGVSPARHPDVIAVSALADHDGESGGQGSGSCDDEGDDDTLATFSNFGDVIDIAAPGTCIASTWTDGRYALSSGTSMAAPHVAGAAALLYAEADLPVIAGTPESVRGILTTTWSVPASHACGFDGGSGEPLLHLACSELAIAVPTTDSTTDPEPVTAPDPEPVPTTEPAPDEGPATDPLPVVSFVDVSDSNVHALAIARVVTAGIANGTSATTYSPERAVTRAQMGTFIANLVRAAGGELPAGGGAFPDIAGTPHRDNIEALAAAGIVSGRADGTYGPADAVTRAQMATFLVRAHTFLTGAELPTGDDHFSDDDGSPHEANIDRAAEAGFASGKGGGEYDPEDAVRRDQMASFIVRVLDGLGIGIGI